MNWRPRSIATLAGAFLFACGAHLAEGRPATTPTSAASVLEWNGRAAQTYLDTENDFESQVVEGAERPMSSTSPWVDDTAWR